MKKLLLIITIVSISFSAISQSNFDRGFEAGYKKGYCLNKGISCLAPLPPLPPLPKIDESLSSYQDGYNRGFERGLNENSGSSNERERYKTATSEFIDYVARINVEDLLAKARILKQAKDKATELYEKGDFERSLRISKAALKVSPKDVEFMMICATCYLELENWNEGINYLFLIVKNSKDKNTIKTCREVISELQSGEYQKARAEEKGKD